MCVCVRVCMGVCVCVRGWGPCLCVCMCVCLYLADEDDRERQMGETDKQLKWEQADCFASDNWLNSSPTQLKDRGFLPRCLAPIL